MGVWIDLNGLTTTLTAVGAGCGSSRRPLHDRGPVLRRQPLWDRPALDAEGWRRGGPGTRHVLEGFSRVGAVSARNELEGVAVHDPSQHVPQHAASRWPQPDRR